MFEQQREGITRLASLGTRHSGVLGSKFRCFSQHRLRAIELAVEEKHPAEIMERIQPIRVVWTGLPQPQHLRAFEIEPRRLVVAKSCVCPANRAAYGRLFERAIGEPNP